MNNILLIHPCEPDRQRLASILRRAGFKVTCAEDGEHGLTHMKEVCPDLVVMANDSPGTKALFFQKGAETVPVLLLGTGDEFARAMMLELGADMYVDVAVGQDELIARAHALLRRYRKGAAHA